MRSFSHLRSRMSIVLSLVALASMIGGFVFLTGTGITTNKALAKSLTYSNLTPKQQGMLSGLVRSEFLLQQNTARTETTTRSNYFPTSDDGCAQNQGNNIQVSQNCLDISDPSLQGHGQTHNEASIAADPFHPDHLVTSYNNYSRGDGNCSSSFSRNGGQTWTDTAIPMGYTNGAAFGNVERQYWQAGGDTSVAWDTKGNAYLECEVFMRGSGISNNPDLSNAFYLFRSTGNGGASWNFPGHPAIENADPSVINDKSYMSIDDQVGSPFQDRIYVTWTQFSGDGSAYIVETHSSDYGQSFSAPVVASTNSSLCANTFGAGTPHGACNENEFSQPFTAPDGTLYVVYDNFNTALKDAGDNHDQVLLSKSTDGGVTFSTPTLVANYNDFPDCAVYQAGQNPGETCIPEKGTTTNSAFLTTNYPVAAIDPVNGSIVVTFGSYISKYSNPANGCIPAGISVNARNLFTGVKTAGACNNKILESISTNGGASFNGNITDPTTMPVVSAAPGQQTTDQWWQWEAFTKDGKLAVSYYDRQYGNNETSGSFDFSLSGSRDLQNFAVRRVTTSSLPLPTQFPDSQGNGIFLGDYTGLLVVGNEAHPIWTDTRSASLTLCPGTAVPGVPPQVCTFTTVPNGPRVNEQNIFTTSENVPTP
jgi:hypothetical protein